MELCASLLCNDSLSLTFWCFKPSLYPPLNLKKWFFHLHRLQPLRKNLWDHNHTPMTTPFSFACACAIFTFSRHLATYVYVASMAAKRLRQTAVAKQSMSMLQSLAATSYMYNYTWDILHLQDECMMMYGGLLCRSRDATYNKSNPPCHPWACASREITGIWEL